MTTARSGKQTGKGFGPEYYRRFYGNPRTAVTGPLVMQKRAQFIGAYLRYMGLSVRNILDAGCGLGWLQGPLLQEFPKARYVGLEASEYLCRIYGWTFGSLATFKPRAPFDLVVCYDVLQYLNERDAQRAMNNLGRISAKALYFSALTRQDWDFYCDQRRTDRDVHMRQGEWYRKRLARHFFPVGGGLYVRRNIDVQLWELERPEY